MARFRYRGALEHVYLGPPVRILSPGEILEAPTNPDPSIFDPIEEPLGDAAARADHGERDE